MGYNAFNIFEIQKDRNKIYQKDGYLPSKKLWFPSGLLCTVVLSTFLGLVLS